MTGKLIGAEEAERIGLANRVAPPEELDGAVQQLADELLACARSRRARQARDGRLGAAGARGDARARGRLAGALRGDGRLRRGRAGVRREAPAGVQRALARASRRRPPGQQVRAERAAEHRLRRACGVEQRRQVDRRCRRPISWSIDTTSSVATLPVAPFGTGQPPSSPKLDSNERTPAS